MKKIAIGIIGVSLMGGWLWAQQIGGVSGQQGQLDPARITAAFATATLSADGTTLVLPAPPAPAPPTQQQVQTLLGQALIAQSNAQNALKTAQKNLDAWTSAVTALQAALAQFPIAATPPAAQ